MHEIINLMNWNTLLKKASIVRFKSNQGTKTDLSLP